jgi:hemerythrin-like domain-containing protein
MVCVHNVLLRGLNSIVLQAPNIPPSSYRSFIAYALTWHKSVSHHHDAEERYFFARLEQQFGAGTMSTSFAEHAAFHDGLDRYAAYLQSVQGGGGASFSSDKLLEIIDGFAPALHLHLTNEIATIMDLARLGGDTPLVGKIWDEAVKAGVADLRFGDLFTEFPFLMLAHDLTYEGGLHTNFPPVPGPMIWVIVNLFALWNWSWWKFSPCDKGGRPKELWAVG